MKKLLLSVLTLGVVSAVAIGATQAYFSDQEEIKGAEISTGTINFDLDLGNKYGGWNFPIVLMPGEDTNFIDPNGLEHDQRFVLKLASGSKIPNHFELKFTTTDFVDGGIESGEVSTMDDYLKALEVTSLYNHTDGWSWNGLTGKINDSLDGKFGFLSLYDLVNTGVLDDIPAGSTLNSYGIVIELPSDAGNLYQGDSMKLNVTIGAAQVSGQFVL